MIREIIRNDITSDICHLGLELNMHHKFCSYTTNTENQSADIKLSLPAGKKITIYWGDGTSTVITGEVYKVIYSHIYTDVKTYNLTVSGDYNDITYLKFDGDGEYSGDIKYFPNSLSEFACTADNTFFGNISFLSKTLVKFLMYGQNVITGDIKDFSLNAIQIVVTGNNTLFGDSAFCQENLYYVNYIGKNTISDYSGKTWTTNFDFFSIRPVSPGGLSSAEIDQLLIDLDNDLDWSGGGTITLTGTNEPPTGVGQAAIDNIIAEGGTVFVNDYTFCSYTTNTENQSADIKLSLPANKKITIYWGDGTSTVITGEVTTTTYSHTYTDVKTYNLTVSGDYNDITYLRFDGDGSYGGDIKYMPVNLIHLECYSPNTFSGDIQYFPINLEFFGCGGQNTFEGNIQYFPINLTFFEIYGKNTFWGDIKYIPVGLTFFACVGRNTISDYSGKTWTTNMSMFKLKPYSGGLSSAEMDQLIIDLDEDLDWSGGGTITLTGTNAPRTSASDDAVNNIEAEGGTIFTNN